MLREPERADEPRIPRHRPIADRALLVGIVLVARHAADLGAHPQLLADGEHGRLDARVVGREGPEAPDAVERGIDGGVLLVRAVGLARQHADEAPQRRIPEPLFHPAPHLVRGAPVALGQLGLAERRRERLRRAQPADHRAAGPGQDAAALLPQIVRGPGQPGRRIAPRGEEVRRPHEVAEERLHHLHVAAPQEALPRRPQHQRGLVLLDGQLLAAFLVEPGMPGGGGRPVGVVLVEQVAARGDRPRAELVELAGDVGVTAGVERGGHDRAVARPHIAVRVARVGDDVVIVGGDDRAAVVDLRAQDQEAAQEEIDHLGRQLGVVEALARHPQPPEGVGPPHERFRAARAQPLRQLLHRGVVLAEPDEHAAPGLAARGHLHVGAHGRIHRALLDGILRERSVLRVDESALRAVEALLAGGIAPHAEALRAEAAEDRVPLCFVVDQAARLGIEEDGVAEVVAEEPQVVVPEEAHFARAAGEVLDLHLADQERLVEVDRVGAAQAQAQRFVGQVDVGDQCVAAVGDAALPPAVLDPGELSVGPHAHAAGVAVGLVLAPDVGPVDVDQLVARVEVHQEISVPQRQRSRHARQRTSP